MFKRLQFVALVGFVATVAACGNSRQDDVVVVEPISVEPTYTGKYK